MFYQLKGNNSKKKQKLKSHPLLARYALVYLCMSANTILRYFARLKVFFASFTGRNLQMISIIDKHIKPNLHLAMTPTYLDGYRTNFCLLENRFVFLIIRSW